VEDLGYAHLVAFDHVLGADISTRPDWRGAYNATSTFHEVFVLFGFLAACTTRLELAPAILILPQRQAVLVAKQAAEVDVLTNGRTRLWRRPWLERGRVPGVGREVPQPGASDRGADRSAAASLHEGGRRLHRTLAPHRPRRPQSAAGAAADPDLDGWRRRPRRPPHRPDRGRLVHAAAPDDAGRARLAAFRSYLREAGRDAASFPIEGRVVAAKRTPDDWARIARDSRSWA